MQSMAYTRLFACPRVLSEFSVVGIMHLTSSWSCSLQWSMCWSTTILNKTLQGSWLAVEAKSFLLRSIRILFEVVDKGLFAQLTKIYQIHDLIPVVGCRYLKNHETGTAAHHKSTETRTRFYAQLKRPVCC